ncbi:hypothetical protein LSTR_LSTR009294 [Laodelphax striatellus]|uniref:Cadherin domain-containing protein n=1 Tax=Laodelphax striatellus TaxID=195883 RepID=A0A482XL28_LAOST|nr:hypothetical protein LSTR_LSTR009294 [Laodelphax striatellus]
MCFPAVLCLMCVVLRGAWAQYNLQPQFSPGGDMAGFSLPEDTRPGAPVYRLQGTDPEGGLLHYSISGEHFNVDRMSGVVKLIKALDRETLDMLEVIISITDESLGGSEPNTVSLRREIRVLDVNDNPPVFQGRPYVMSVAENARIGSLLYTNISVTDRDSGVNAELDIKCLNCDEFDIETIKIDEGQYAVAVVLAKQLDYESAPGYSLILEASDTNPLFKLTATASVAVDVIDIQDQPPVFLNSPYSATIQENTPPGQSVLSVKSEDGDAGNPRPVSLTLEGDDLHYFRLISNGSGQATIVTSMKPIDREHPDILQSGGVYTFLVKATELINNELPGDFNTERITVVITDEDDQIPHFNRPNFEISVGEDIGIGTPLPGLNMVVSDDDVGDNARFMLMLQSEDARVKRWFRVDPVMAQGRVPVVIRVNDKTGLDYDAGVRQLHLNIVALIPASEDEMQEVASSSVKINILDANDNPPVFSQPSYSFTIPEDLTPGSLIANVTATDKDSGEFGKITYSLRGFGMDKFGTNLQHGNLYLLGKVDYEKQSSYSLTMEAKDGGGRIVSTNIQVHLTDINDNAPVFEFPDYRRTVREGATTFKPQFYVRATDADNDGKSRIRYSLLTSNSDVLTVDTVTGEVKMLRPVSSSHTSRGQYELMIRAFDDGDPQLHGSTAVYVRVGVPGNQRPVFRGSPYNVTIPENLSPDSAVLTVRATDPDGPDNQVSYRIGAGADNFYINSSSGAISVSKAAILDPDVTGMWRYSLTVLAVDSGVPLRETAQTLVTVNIADVQFSEIVLKVTAVDPDLDANLEYSIVEPIRAADKTGVIIRGTYPYDYKNAFSINKTTGEISVNSTLDHQTAAVIILTVQAVDLNAVENIEDQKTKVEVTLYIQAYNVLNPKFTVGSWSPKDPTIRVNVPEEKPVGSTLLTLAAIDSLNNSPITSFTPTTRLPSGLALHTSGNIELTQRLDYEAMENKTLSFRVQAISEDLQRTSEALVLLIVQDINDHSPKFSQKSYKGSVLESANQGTPILTVKATDGDMARGANGFGDIRYAISGENAGLFEIDPLSGDIKVSGNGTIDRERQSVLRFVAIATDTPNGGANQRRSTVPIIIEVEDVNDNAPQFSVDQYTAVVLENVPPGTSVLNVTATDLDTGLGKQITYELVDQGEAVSLFTIGASTGEIRTAKPLTGKGRAEHYSLTLRAQDGGQPSLFTDVGLKLVIGDVVNNDGIPMFIHPKLDEMAYISENSSIGSPVFRVVAADPDDPNSPEGQLRFSFLQDGADSLAFKIDPETGLITTKQQLDREKKEKYSLILVAQDSGAVPQQATRLLTVFVTDIDDHKPYFKRTLDEGPLEFSVEEELPIGSEIGIIEAIDLDVGENAEIGYLITFGNEDGLFSLNRNDNNQAVISVANRLDRETAAEHTITVKCFKLSAQPYSLRKQYNRQDTSERQIRIKVSDIDDNLPLFSDNNITIGVRVNVPVDTQLLTLSASDVDADAAPIAYHLESTQFSRPLSPLLNGTQFAVDSRTGQLLTAAQMTPFSDGHFTLRVFANNSAQKTYATIKIFVVRERGLLKFVFGRPPADVRQNLVDFRHDVEKALALSGSLNVYDTQFHSKPDGSLDFSSTSSCFQLVGSQTYDVKEMESMLKDNPKLEDVYSKYIVQSVERCAPVVGRAGITWVQWSVLGIASFIGVASVFAACILCCSYSRWQRFR